MYVLQKVVLFYLINPSLVSITKFFCIHIYLNKASHLLSSEKLRPKCNDVSMIMFFN